MIKQILEKIDRELKKVITAGNYLVQPKCIKYQTKILNEETKRFCWQRGLIVRFDFGKFNKDKIILNQLKVLPIIIKDKRLINGYFNKINKVLNNFIRKHDLPKLETRIIIPELSKI